MMVSHKTFRLLIPLLIFCGLQQAFVFSDFNLVGDRLIITFALIQEHNHTRYWL